MKTDKEHLIDALLLTMIYFVLSILMQVGNLQILSIVALIIQILSINKFIRYAQDNSDFKMARFAFVGTFVASTAMVVYTMNIVAQYVNSSIDPNVVIAENKGILVMVFVAMVIAQAVTYFLTQGCARICRNEIQDSKLADLFDKFKFLILGFMVLGLVSSFSPIISELHNLLSYGYQVLIIYAFWQLRQALIASVNA